MDGILSGKVQPGPFRLEVQDHAWKVAQTNTPSEVLTRMASSLRHLRSHTDSGITDQINTSTPAGRFFFHVMASLAQMERELIVERTRAGLDAARRQGRVGGRKRQMTDSKMDAARKLLLGETSPKDVAKNLGVSVPTLYRWLPASERD